MPEQSTAPFATLEEANIEVSRLSALLQESTTQLGQAKAQINTITEQNGQLQTALIRARAKATQTIAAAGISPLEETGGTSMDDDDNPAHGLVGLKRAIAANTARARSPREQSERFHG